jgi:glycosyltransferase involved in cell wall biosynthesis
MRKVLWLPSWYPNKTDPFDGDFIQRMAMATALYDEVHVIYVVASKEVKGEEVVETTQSGNLHETIIYYPARGVFKKWLWRRYFTIYKKYIRQFIRQNGKPHCVHVQVPLKAGMIALWLQRKYGIPFVLTEHYGIYNEVVPDRFGNRSFYFRYFTRKIIQQAGVLMPVSHKLGEAINSMVIKKSFTVVPNVVDTGLFFYQPVPANPFRFIHVSNMIPLKNVEGIINAFACLHQQQPGVELLLLGPYPASVLDHARQTGLLQHGISFGGEVPYKAVAQSMQQCQSLILFSDSENMPCVVLEALCCGLPVIATAVGGVPEVVNEKNGLLVPPRQEKELLAAMQAVLHQYDQYNREQIAARAQQQYGYSVIGSMISRVYERQG